MREQMRVHRRVDEAILLRHVKISRALSRRVIFNIGDRLAHVFTSIYIAGTVAIYKAVNVHMNVQVL